MKIFLDTADYKKIAQYADTGLIDGVTINPTLLKVQNEPPVKIVHEILRMLPNAEVNLQVTEQEPKKVYLQAQQIAQLAENMIVKIPCHNSYIPVIDKLLQNGIPVNSTLVFNLAQALTMAKLGVNYISVFVGRLDDDKQNGLEIAQRVQEMLDNYDFDSELLVASVRTQEHVLSAISFAADAITMSPEIFAQLTEDPLSQAGLEKFKNDWANGPHGSLLE